MNKFEISYHHRDPPSHTTVTVDVSITQE